MCVLVGLDLLLQEEAPKSHRLDTLDIYLWLMLQSDANQTGAGVLFTVIQGLRILLFGS